MPTQPGGNMARRTCLSIGPSLFSSLTCPVRPGRNTTTPLRRLASLVLRAPLSRCQRWRQPIGGEEAGNCNCVLPHDPTSPFTPLRHQIGCPFFTSHCGRHPSCASPDFSRTVTLQRANCLSQPLLRKCHRHSRRLQASRRPSVRLSWSPQ